MTNLFTNSGVIIAAGHALSGIAEHGQELQVVSGRVWVTVEDIAQDYWLYAGDILAIPARRLVVEADKIASCVRTRTQSAHAVLPDLRAWFADALARAARGSVSAVGHLLAGQRR